MSVWGAVAAMVLLAGGAALTLRVVEQLGRAVSASTHDRTWSSLGELERTLGHRVALPAYFPKTLRWPPSRVQSSGRRPTIVVVGFVGAEGGAERLLLAQTLGEPGELPEGVLPHATVLDTQEVAVGAAPAKLRRLLGEDGFTWYELSWDFDEQSLVLRTRGTVEQLLAMGDSLRREGP